MAHLQTHLRNKFLAGIFAALPLAVTVFLVWYVESKTRIITETVLGVNIPFLGIAIALVGVYVLGLAVTSLLGRLALNVLDKLLSRIPGLRGIYMAWKQVSLIPGGTEGTFSKVVLIPVETGNLRCLGFTSGAGLPGDPETLCVFVPAVPNPIAGRLYFVRRCDCVFLDIAPEEAFKVLLSTGNWVPEAVRLENAVEG